MSCKTPSLSLLCVVRIWEGDRESEARLGSFCFRGEVLFGVWVGGVSDGRNEGFTRRERKTEEKSAKGMRNKISSASMAKTTGANQEGQKADGLR